MFVRGEAFVGRTQEARNQTNNSSYIHSYMTPDVVAYTHSGYVNTTWPEYETGMQIQITHMEEHKVRPLLLTDLNQLCLYSLNVLGANIGQLLNHAVFRSESEFLLLTLERRTYGSTFQVAASITPLLRFDQGGLELYGCS